MRLDLAQAGQVVFDRIFSRRNIDVGRIDLIQRAVQRGRLSRTCGAGDVDNPVRLSDHRAQLFDSWTVQDDLVQGQEVAALVQNTHDDLLAELGRHG